MAAEKWRKRPVVVDACVWDGSSAALAVIRTWGAECGRSVTSVSGGGTLLIPTLEGDHEAQRGDYIIRGVQGEIYPCKPDIFLTTYERTTSGPEVEPLE